MTKRILFLIVIFTIASNQAMALKAPRDVEHETEECSSRKIQEVLDKDKRSLVEVDCNLNLKESDRISRPLAFSGAKASGVSMKCNGAKIDGRDTTYAIVVRSILLGKEWSAPRDISIEGCEIQGSVRVYGMGTNGQGPEIIKSSREEGHTERVQAAAPYNIKFDKIKFISDRSMRIPVYVSPGSRKVSLTNSRFDGSLAATAIYLDAESSGNIIQNNRFQANPDFRELIAVDGSANNKIIGNYFSGLGKGGIFIYRNCGEGGNIRHQVPHNNQIINNAFYYKNMDPNFLDKLNKIIGLVKVFDIFNLFDDIEKVEFPFPTVWISQRNGLDALGNRQSFCSQDNGSDFGSSANDRDLAVNTVVLENRILSPNARISPDVMIKYGRTVGLNDYRPQYIINNSAIESDDSLGELKTPTKRLSSCFVKKAFPSPIIASGKSVSVFKDLETDKPTCTGFKVSCTDGVTNWEKHECGAEDLKYKNVKVVNFACRTNSNTNGCLNQTTECPAGTKIIAAKAACNLEYGEITHDDVLGTPWNILNVIRRTTRGLNSSTCQIDTDVQLLRFTRRVQLPENKTKINFACREPDDNGGDCHIRGKLLCQ